MRSTSRALVSRPGKSRPIGCKPRTSLDKGPKAPFVVPSDPPLNWISDSRFSATAKFRACLPVMKNVSLSYPVALAVISFTLSAFAQSPSAEDLAWRAQKNQSDCTFFGSVSRECVSVRNQVWAVQDARHASWAAAEARPASRTPFVEPPPLLGLLEDCFNETLRNEANKKGGQRLEGPSAQNLIREAAPEEDPRVKECYRLTSVLHGPTWRKETDELMAEVRYYDKLRKDIEDSFQGKCGVSARGEGAGGLVLVLAKPSKNKKTFFSGTTPNKQTIVISCTGTTTVTGADGSRRVSQASTEAARTNEAVEHACMMRCASTNIACPSHNHTDSVCSKACKAICEK
jgi:hypothetical protein